MSKSNSFERGIWKVILMLGLAGGYNNNAAAADVSSGKPVVEATTGQKAINYSKVKIKSMADLEKLFNRSLPIIFPELVLEEVPMKTAYDDGGRYKGKKNTVGVGSMYSPLNMNDYKKAGVIWYAVRRNPTSFHNRTYSYSDMAKLAIGWAYRTEVQNITSGQIITGKSVLERMLPLLKGASLRPNEFSALYCACYNNENNIANLCAFIRDNCDDPIKCANKIMFWDKEPGMASNAGTVDRCLFEALVYVNVDGFCESMMNMSVCPGKRASCIVLKIARKRQGNLDKYRVYSNKCKKSYLGVVYKKGKVTVKSTVDGLGDLLNGQIAGVIDEYTDKLQQQYDASIKIYDSKDYNRALTAFLDLQKAGAEGADILNDIAITYFNLGEYEKCIQYCQKVLQIGDRLEYAKAVYNAGRAYEQMGKKGKALQNFKKAEEYFNAYGIADCDSSVNYLQIYRNAQSRVKER